MRAWFSLILAGMLISDCAVDKPVRAITLQYKILQEGPFTIHYPEDWQISSTITSSVIGTEKTIYTIRHPRNRHCRIIIEAIGLRTPSAEKTTFNGFLSERLRVIREDFRRQGFRDFSAKTFRTTLAGQSTTKLTMTGSKKGVRREVSLYPLRRRTHFYTVAYEWRDHWDPEAKKILLKRIHSFTLRQ